jgi:hypothetical protein
MTEKKEETAKAPLEASQDAHSISQHEDKG